ncbi:MAG: hypothetical protein UIG59_00365 [Acutalibacteraceae bacterium]|nr:hypothetical protein [Acutalibacteraceae bacterium]
MKKKICVTCSTENENHFTYCKYCGAPLPVIDRAPVIIEGAECSCEADANPILEDGISREEYRAYIGKSADRILPVFEKMEETKSRFYFCIPVLVLGLIFGFYGIAAWFFSRRIIKYGWLATLCGVLLTGLNFFFNLPLNTVVIETLASLGPDAYKILAYYDPVSVSGLIGAVAAFFASVFGLSIYKDKAKKDILKTKACINNQDELLYTLTFCGGRRISYAAIPFFFWLNTSLISLAVSMF